MNFNIREKIRELRKNGGTDVRISEVIISSDITLVDDEEQMINKVYEDHGMLTISQRIQKEKGIVIFYESNDSFVAVRVEKVKDIPLRRMPIAQSAKGSSSGSLEK